MAIDPTDTARDEARRAEQKKSEKKRDTNRVQGEKSFQSQFQSKIKKKDSDEVSKKSEGQKGEESNSGNALFQKVIEVYSQKHEGHQKDENQKELKKKETKKDEEKKEGISEDRDSSTANTQEDGHKRIEGNEYQDQGRGGGGSDGSGGRGDGGSQSFSGGTSGGGSDQPGGNLDSDLKDSKSKVSSKVLDKQKFANKLSASSLKKDGRGHSGQDHLSEEMIAEIVDSVSVHVNSLGQHEMEIQLSNEIFSGLKFKLTQTDEGLILDFNCPTNKTKNLFLLARPKLYTRLSEKNIKLKKIVISG